ncbi:MAG: class I SAM-dependent methyltransferase [Pirellulaceae bacterium]
MARSTKSDRGHRRRSATAGTDAIGGTGQAEPHLYDMPRYLEATFREETRPEADFIAAACERYGRSNGRRLLEPGCGGGRLLVELARRGYQLTGFDISQPALAYLQRRLRRFRLSAEVFAGDLAQFQVSAPVDAAYCTYNTFRHLLTESSAVQHLQCVARCLRPGGIYILGLHLIPLDADESCIERWTGRVGKTEVRVTLRVVAFDRRRRIERLRLSLLARHPERVERCRTEFPLRLYTAAQFRRLLRQVPEFELCDVFDFWYDLDHPLTLNDDISDTVVILRKRGRALSDHLHD